MALTHKSSEYLNDALRSGGLIFVAGATGLVGRAVVADLASRGAYVVAHVRPESREAAQWQARFAAMGATVAVDTTPWELRALCATLQTLAPRAVICAIGTTRKTAARAGIAGNIYQTVDVALCRMLAQASAAVASGAANAAVATPEGNASPRFVLLSSVGAAPSRNAYLQARHDMEAAVRDAGLAATIFRPSIIVGDRDEPRPGEAFAAGVGDGLLAAVGLVAPKLRARYRSISPEVLARQIADAARDPDPWRIVEGKALRR